MKQRLASVPPYSKKPAKGIKWDHHRELMKYKPINGHLPTTMKLTKQALSAMLSRFKTVFVKPNQGAFGEGVMQVRKIHHEKQLSFRVHSGTLQKIFRSKDELYEFIRTQKVKDDYLVQEGIELLQWNKRPFDLRLMMKKQSDGTWRNEGFVGRAAHPKKIVTNIRSGGTAVSIEDLLAPYTNPIGRSKIIRSLNELGSRICKQLESKYPGIQLFGIDMGLDRNLKPWVIEVNTRPEKICWECLRKLYKKSAK